MTDVRRRIPRTDTLLAAPVLVEATRTLGTSIVKAAVVRAQQRARRGEIEPEAVADAAVADLPGSACGMRPVINATGVVVHTNLGRAPLSDAAVDAVVAAAGYTDVEFDLQDGERARRGGGALAALADSVPAAEQVHVVNNNAAALLLCALALAPGKEIVISRGELVEIGDGFRIPDLLTSGGARLREVGTTNRTTMADYEQAVGEETGFVLRVHPSNFQITGFTATPGVSELASLGVPVVCDIGSGMLAPSQHLPEEPDAASALHAGAAVVTASADKLLGGPQAGLVLGQTSLVNRVRRHPSARAMRVDKLTLAALEATLRGPNVPVAAALGVDQRELRQRAERVVEALRHDDVPATVVDTDSVVGGGGAPGVVLPSAAVSLPAEHAPLLRRATPPVVGRVEDGRCLLDLRTVEESSDGRLTDAVRAVAGCR